MCQCICRVCVANLLIKDVLLSNEFYKRYEPPEHGRRNHQWRCAHHKRRQSSIILQLSYAFWTQRQRIVKYLPVNTHMEWIAWRLKTSFWCLWPPAGSFFMIPKYISFLNGSCAVIICYFTHSLRTDLRVFAGFVGLGVFFLLLFDLYK